MRASLFANATASLFLCNRSDAVFSHAPKLNRDQLCGRIRRTFAALDQQRAQIFATPLGDAAQDRPATGAVLSRHDAEPGTKIAPAFKSLTGADRRHHGGRDQRPDPWDTHQPPGTWPRSG